MILSERLKASLLAGGVGDPPVVTQLGTYQSSGNYHTYTYSSAPFGTDVSGRGIIVIVNGGGENRDWVSCTIGGVSATEIVQAGAGATNTSIAMFYGEPSGTSGDVVVNSDPGASTMARAQISVISITGHNATPTDTDYFESTTASSTGSLSMDLPQNGVCIMAASSNSNATFTWTNATELFDFQVSGESHSMSGAVRTASSPETGTSISYTASASNDPVYLAASFGPA